ncbi:hypothetical protein XELAEV_18005948mg [Xenopus laevis]|uniref:GIY-YIG domain-containing protein n=1 Tax=Xenopus laevis TaxID=8355 RepID=A0A974DZA4_XENLA|nr:hypothetical protein XELAEV_18005948mg [Xenopus laevis]
MIVRSALPKTTKAGGIYIGETGQKLRTRVNHHRHKINTKSCDTPGTLKLNGKGRFMNSNVWSYLTH